jgi:hypothetical protein
MAGQGSETRHRERKIETRVSATEYDRIRREAGRSGLPLSTYVRRVLTGRRIVAAADAEAVAKLGQLVDLLDAMAGEGVLQPERFEAVVDEIESVLDRLLEENAGGSP